MKWTVCGFNQEKLIERGLDIVDAEILRWFVDFYSTDAVVKLPVKTENGKVIEYALVKYKEMLKDLPVLGITNTHVAARRFDKLCKAGVMVKKLEQSVYPCFYLVGSVVRDLLANDIIAKEPLPLFGSNDAEREAYLKESRWLGSGIEGKDYTPEMKDLPFDPVPKSTGSAVNPVLKSTGSAINPVLKSTGCDSKVQGESEYPVPKSTGYGENIILELVNIVKTMGNSLEKLQNDVNLVLKSTGSSEKVQKKEENPVLKSETPLKNLEPCTFEYKLSSSEEERKEEASSSLSSSTEGVTQKYNPPQKEIDTLAKTLVGINSELFFTNDFYVKALRFIKEQSIFDTALYGKFVFDEVKRKGNVKDFRSYYFTVFDKPEIAALYKAEEAKRRAREEEKKKEHVCPVCAYVYDKTSYEACPKCECPSEYNDTYRIESYRKKWESDSDTAVQDIAKEFFKKHPVKGSDNDEEGDGV